MARARTAARTGRRTAAHHRKLQSKRARADTRRPPKETESAMQAGARRYPAPPLPRQHQRKPGHETRLDPPPMYEAPYWKGSFKLLDKVALITGGDSGIGRAVAVLFAREGADVAIVHLAEPEDAELTACRGGGGTALPGDRGRCGQAGLLLRRSGATVKELGGLDVLVNNAAFQLHISRFEDLGEEQFDRTLKTNLYGYSTWRRPRCRT